MDFAEKCYRVFEHSTADYHVTDDVDADTDNPYAQGTPEHALYAKNRVDAVQWHLEDQIRRPEIAPGEALAIKRRIDRLNQERTDMVEEIDAYFLKKYAHVQVRPGATINTESPAWAIDRLSILALKIYHMRIEATRTDATEAHRTACAARLEVLQEQRADLITAIDRLLDDIGAGRKYMKVYKQMKLYNNPRTNPAIYANKKHI